MNKDEDPVESAAAASPEATVNQKMIWHLVLPVSECAVAEWQYDVAIGTGCSAMSRSGEDAPGVSH